MIENNDIKVKKVQKKGKTKGDLKEIKK